MFTITSQQTARFIINATLVLRSGSKKIPVNEITEFEWYSEILPRLWQGGTPDEEMIDVSNAFSKAVEEHGFTAVVTLDSRSNPVEWAVPELRYGFTDGPVVREELPRILEVADWAYEKWQRGEKVLIRCAAGANRSGLITAIVLMKDGLDPKRAIETIRRKRSYALSNSEFVRLIGEIGGVDLT